MKDLPSFTFVSSNNIDTFGKNDQWVIDCNVQWTSQPWLKRNLHYDYGYFTDENTGAKYRAEASKWYQVLSDEGSYKVLKGSPNFKISIGYRF